MEDKLTEFEENVLKFVKKYKEMKSYYQIDFIYDLRKIMPPTCGKEQRKFLNEVESNGKIDSEGYLVFPSYEPYYDSPGTQLDQSDFESDLSKVIKGE
jgi:hypothetical protein